MSSNGRRPSRQRIGDAPSVPQSIDGDRPYGRANEVYGPSPGYGQSIADPSHAPQEPLYGLAADLAGVPPSQVVGPTGGPLAARPPARLGSARSNRPIVPPPVMPVRPPSRGPTRPTSAAAANNAPAADPFAVADLQRQQQHLPPGPDGEVPYGLALELINNQEPAFGPVDPVGDRRRERERRRGRSQGPVRLGSPDRAAVHHSSQPTPLDPFTVMELAASQEGLPEPDYGLVAELRNRVAPDPFADDYGLVAEVARRRSRSPSPLGRGVGVLPPLRARKRMDPVTGFGFEGASDMAEPFSAARRPGEDPFSLADEQIKIPKELVEPYEPSQQEAPGDSVLLKTDGGSETSRVSRDDQEYGIAEELGVDPATGRRQGFDEFGMPLPGEASDTPLDQPEPAGHKYTYDEDTGMLTTTAGGQGEGGRIPKQYIEDEVTGTFYKLHSKRRKLLSLFRRKEPVVADDDDDDDDDAKGFRGSLRSTLTFIVNFFNILGMFAQGLVGGFAILNFFMTYMMYSGGTLTGFLRYYSPLAQNNNRIYYSLLVLAVISSTARLARDKLRNFMPRKLLLAPVDFGQMLLFVVAYIASVICTPLDDELTYEYNRNPRFYQLTFSSSFKKRLALWHTLNLIRTICAGLAWVLTCYQTCPYVFDTTLRADLRALRKQDVEMRRLIGRSGLVATDGRTSPKAA